MARTQSTQALCAKAVRKELKAMGLKPDLVRSEGFSNGDAVRVQFTDVPKPKRNIIEKALAKYQYGHFNGMEDIYEYSNCQEDVPQVKYVTINFKASDELKQKALKNLIETFNGMEDAPDDITDSRWQTWRHPKFGDHIQQMVWEHICSVEDYNTFA